MAGTGLPTISGAPVLADPGRVVDGDKFSNAGSWDKIAAVGDRITALGVDQIKFTEHQAQVGYLADQDVEIARKRAEYRDAHANDPAGFDASWNGYSEGKLTEAAPWAVNHIRKQLGNEGNSAFTAILNERRAKTTADSTASWNSLENMASNDVNGSAMAGTFGGPVGQEKLAKYRAVIDTGVTSGFITKDEAERRIAGLQSTATIYAARTGIKSTFDQEGPNGALKHIDDLTRDEKLSLSPEQRFALGSRLRADVHAWNAEREQNVSQVDLEAASLKTAKAGGVPVEQSRIQETVERYKKVGGHAQAAAFLADIQHADEVSFYNRVPLDQAAADLRNRGYRAGVVAPPAAAATAVDFFVGKGWTKEQASGIVGNLLHESNLNPNTVHDGGTGLGIAGWRDDPKSPTSRRRSDLFDFARARGASPTDLQTQLEFVDHELRTKESRAGDAVRAARTPDEAAAAFLHFERPLNYDPNDTSKSHGYSNRVGMARVVAGGRYADLPAGSAAAPVSEIGNIGRASKIVSERVAAETKSIADGMRAENPVLPTPARMSALLDAAAATNSPDVLMQVSQVAAEYQTRRDTGRAPLPEQAAAVSGMQRQAVTGGLNETEKRQYEVAQDTYNKAQKALADDPLAHTISANAETSTLPSPTPLDIANPIMFRAGLGVRSQWAEVGTRTYQTEPMPALTAAEAGQVRSAIDAADPAGKARIYGDINALPPQTRAATLSQIAKGKGAGGMVEAFAGSMFGVEPAVGESIMRGQAAMKVKDTYNLEKSSNKDAATEALDKALPAGAFSLAARTDPTGAYATMRGAVIARAADLAATDPNFKGEFADATVQRAVADVTGGIVTHNGAPAIAPVRGMTQRQFDARVWGVAAADMAGVMTQSGQPITPDYLRSNAQLESIADGRYLVRLGRDAERPIYAFRDVGANVAGRMRPFVLDLRNVAPNYRGASIGPDPIKSPYVSATANYNPPGDQP